MILQHVHIPLASRVCLEMAHRNFQINQLLHLDSALSSWICAHLSLIYLFLFNSGNFRNVRTIFFLVSHPQDTGDIND